VPILRIREIIELDGGVMELDAAAMELDAAAIEIDDRLHGAP
jgi:hypothetical protein